MFWIILCLLNILFPPLAVGLLRGLSGSFVISIILTVMAWIPGVFFGFWCIIQDYLDDE
jgi:uncharacterized membrane protein YqaE (UPF0057 family)